MQGSASVRFFDQQFQNQLRDADLRLNPFEEIALPWLQGHVLDYGCGLGNLSLAAARRGCSVLALDASPTAIAHLRQVASTEALRIEAVEADLADYPLQQDFDTVVSIGLLMLLDCDSALRQLNQLQARLHPGGVAVINLLVQASTYTEMLDPQRHCLLSAQQLRSRFEGWHIEQDVRQDFPAPGQRVKSFVTLIARKPSV